MRCSIERVVFIAAACVARAAGAQHYADGDPYMALSAGAAFEQAVTDPNYRRDVYGRLGPAFAFAIGNRVSERLAFEVRAGGAWFPPPTYITNPGGCRLSGSVCPPEIGSSDLRAFTLGANAMWVRSRTETSPMVLGGMGVRVVNRATYDEKDIRPYAEIGAGVATPLGKSQLFIDARLQAAPASRFMPHWTLPIELGVRF